MRFTPHMHDYGGIKTRPFQRNFRRILSLVSVRRYYLEGIGMIGSGTMGHILYLRPDTVFAAQCKNFIEMIVFETIPNDPEKKITGASLVQYSL